jgi:DNA modification methylase
MSREEKIDKNGRMNNNTLNDLDSKEWVKFTKSWFIHNPKPRKANEKLHPAKFPEDMIADFIKFFTKKGQSVFDPFLGTGSTLVACTQTNRIGFGIELNKKYASIAKERSNQRNMFDLSLKQTVINGDAKYLKTLLIPEMEKKQIKCIDFVITSPPYWNILRKSRGGVNSASKQRVNEGLDEFYSDDKEDLGNIENYESFLDVMTEIFDNIYDILKDRGYMVIIVQNFLAEDGVMVPLAWDLAKRLSKKYTLKQEKIWCQDNKQLGCWGYPNTYVSNVHHHYCLIFQKRNRIL